MRFETKATATNISGLTDRPLSEGIPVIHPSRFYAGPSIHNNFNAVRGLGYLEILFGIVFKKVLVYSSKEISDFQLHCGRFFPGEFKLIFREF